MRNNKTTNMNSNISKSTINRLFDNIQPDKKIVFPDWFLYERAEITTEVDGEFSWVLHRNYKVSGGVGYVFPLNGNMVIHFKTFKGAVRNLMKYLDHWIVDDSEMHPGVMGEESSTPC